jgi:uracil-DNA glycosylase
MVSLDHDSPWSLGDLEAREARVSRLNEPHVKPLTEFVERLRQETGFGTAIPYFDPMDGGIGANCLFLSEAPGPKAVKSGFVSRDNPDFSARNFLELNQEAGIPRQKTLAWNIVPWYIGSGKKIRPATTEDVRKGQIHLAELLLLLPNLSIVVLGGNKAQAAEAFVKQQNPKLEIVKMMHTSPLVVNTNKENRKKILGQLQLVAALLASKS